MNPKPIRLPKGALDKIATVAGVPKTAMCDFIGRNNNVTKARAIELEARCAEVGLDITKEEWVFADENQLKRKITRWFQAGKSKPLS